MTPLQLANAECANSKLGRCAGMDIRADGVSVRGNFGGDHCRLAKGERCTYFETAVAPMAEYCVEPRKAKSYLDAAYTYRRQHPEMDLKQTRLCPDCKDVPIGGGDRFCPGCKAKRRAESTRKAQARFRLLKSDAK